MTGAHAGPGWGRAVSSRHGTVMVRWFAAIGKRRCADGQLVQLARQQVAQGPGADGGALRLWTYSNTYKDEAMTEQQFLNADYVVGYGAAVEGFKMYGAIMDKGAMLRPLARFPKMWDQEDPSATFVMTQSAPLMVPVEPNNTFVIKTRG